MGAAGSPPLQKLGKYEILGELGHGAMGVVYRARDPFIDRLVALKTINSNLVDRPDLLERFYQEAQSAGKLQHPNIVTIFELGQEKDTPFIAMEYLDGESLEKTIVRQSDMPVALKVGYIVKICQALEYAHKNRVVHRDIKPGNIMVNSEGLVKVVDFGIARLVDFSRTHTNMMIGTPAYMAPELFRKRKADERTDIWAVGVTFYELICYQRPFMGDGYDIIRCIMEDEFTPITSLVPECSPEVEAVIQRMLRKQAAERYQSMEDVLLDLEPLWNRLRVSAANTLAERGREFYELGDLVRAHETLREARLIDHSNVLAKSLLEKVYEEKRRTDIQPKVQEHLNRGRELLESGKYREARAEAEAALGLDSRHELAQKLVAEAEAAAAQAQLLDQKLRLTKQRLAEGALTEAETSLRQALEIDGSHTQALELKRQIEEEQARRERRRQLADLLHRARAFWTELKYDECLALLAEGLKAFPNEPELKTLQETARADQAEQKKQMLVADVRKLLGQQKLQEARKALDVLTHERPQDATVRNLQSLLVQVEQEEKRKKRLEAEMTNLRSLVGTGKLTEVVAKGEPLLKEFPEEYEIRDLVTYAKGEVAQQERRKTEQAREKQIRELLEAQRYQEAGEMARRALLEFPNLESLRVLAAEAEAKNREQEEKEKTQREVQQRIQEIRSKIKRQELTDAIDLARQTLATMGPDTDVTQLLHAAEVESEERKRKREEREKQLGAARTLLEKQDAAGAKRVLDMAMATRILEPADMQAKMLLSQIAEQEQAQLKEDNKRKKEEQRKRAEKDKEEEKKRGQAQKQTKPGMEGVQGPAGADKDGSSGGTGAREHVPPAPQSIPAQFEPTRIDSATMMAGSSARPKPSVPVMTPLPAVPQGPAVETRIRIEDRMAEAPVAPAAGGLFRKPVVLAALVVLLAGGIYAVVHFMPKGAEKPTAEDLALETEAKQLWESHKPDESLADWKKLAGHPGLLHDQALKQVSDIEQQQATVEQLYAQGMKLLYEEKKYPEAAQKFNQVVQMNLWKVDEARKEYEVASKGPGETPAKPLWQAFFDDGKQAYDRKDYAAALQDMQQASSASGVSKSVSVQAQRLIPVIRDREEQRKNLEQAKQLEGAGQKEQAKAMFTRVVKARNGDPELVADARNQIEQIGTIPPPQPKPTPNPPPKSAPDYAPVFGEVRSLIGQGRWDDAETKLTGVPPTEADYNVLKQQIDAGRLADQEFSQRKAEFEQADASKNKNALRGLRQYFVTESSNGGRHSGEARGVASQIDADLKEVEVVKPPATGTPGGNGGGNPVSSDAEKINSVVQHYAKAYDEGNIGALRAVREYDLNAEKKLPELLKAVKGKGYALRNCSAPQISGDTATISCDAMLTKMKNPLTARTNIHLKNFDGQWIIVSSD